MTAVVNRETIKQNGWGLGKVFTCQSASSIVDKINDDHKFDDQIFIAVTHDCSVISTSLTNEPFIEYLSAHQIEKENGQFINARNIRRLHLIIQDNGIDTWYEVSMRMRGFVSRKTIENCSTDRRFLLPVESINSLKRWLANRYISQTFPDKFNQLTNPLVKNSKAPLIKAFNTETGKACNSIFISLTPDDKDIQKHEFYTVEVVLLFRDKKAESLGRGVIEDFGKDVSNILNQVDGLSSEVFSLAESDVNYSDIIKMSRWQLDYISLNDSNSEILGVDHS